jgi:hypothetical protein
VTTVNLDEESGASLRAAGFTFEREMAARPGWDRPSRPRGELSSDAHRKRRWVAACAVVAVLLAVASGCSQPARITPAYERVIDPAWRDVAASWITITAEAANPKSDEEPEDMLRQLEWTAEWLFGRATLGAYVQPGSAAGETNRRAVFVTYNEAGDNVRRVIDAWVGAR